jgi:hypothetical protein
VKGQAPLKLQGFLPLLLRDEISLAICPAVDGANGGRATELEAEINDLLNEKEEIEKWATAGSALTDC